jgi:transcriptional regulator with XRE-family HTH domain
MITDKGLPVIDGEKVREKRLRMGLSIRDLAKRANLSPVTVNRTELRRSAVRHITLRSLANALGCEPADLYVKTEE